MKVVHLTENRKNYGKDWGSGFHTNFRGSFPRTLPRNYLKILICRPESSGFGNDDAWDIQLSFEEAIRLANYLSVLVTFKRDNPKATEMPWTMQHGSVPSQDSESIAISETATRLVKSPAGRSAIAEAMRELSREQLLEILDYRRDVAEEGCL